MKKLYLKILLIFYTILILSVYSTEKSHKQRAKIQPQLDSQHYANKVFAQSPQGRDHYEDIHSDDVYLEVQRLTGKTLKNAKFNQFLVKLNRNAIFYQNFDKSYRGVLGSIHLSEIITADDQPQKGQCCKQIGQITKNNINVLGVQKVAQCFKISAQYDKWSLCFDKIEKAQQWRKNIIMNVIKQALEKQGINNINFVVSDIPNLKQQQQKNHYSWVDQKAWGSTCKKGLAQSPIQIQTNSSQNMINMRLKLDLQDKFFDNNLNKTKKKIPRVAFAAYDGSQVSVLGNFGQLIHEVNAQAKIFHLQKLQFKFQSEHTIDSQVYDCEVLIHGQTSSGIKSITSVLLRADDDNISQENKFLDDLDSETWEFKVGEKIRLAQQPRLNDLLKDLVQKDFIISYYWYMGSETEPGCEEGVNRFVIDVPITVPKQQLDVIRAHVYDNKKETKGNFRIPIRLDSSRQLYHHQEKLCPLAKQTKTVATVQIDPTLVPQQSKENKKQECKKTEKQLIKATSEVSTYTFTDQNLMTGKIKEGVKIQDVQENEVPKEIAKALKQEAKLEAQNSCRKNKLQKVQSKLEETQNKHQKANLDKNSKLKKRLH